MPAAFLRKDSLCFVVGLLWWEIELLNTAWEHGRSDKSHAENCWFLMLINIFVCLAKCYWFFFSKKCKRGKWSKKAQLMSPLMSVKIVIVYGFFETLPRGFLSISTKKSFCRGTDERDLRITLGRFGNFHRRFCLMTGLQVKKRFTLFTYTMQTRKLISGLKAKEMFSLINIKL